MGEGIKHDKQKTRWDLVPFDCLEEVAKVYTFGAEKYGDNNWKDLDCPQERYFAALMRHLTEWKNGKIKDKETGLNHMAHIAWNSLALLWFDNKLEEEEKEYIQSQTKI